MSDIKRTAFIVLIVTLLFSNFTSNAYAADVDHNELMQYDGYGQAMYESIVEQTTYITGQYTNNQEYVKQSINEIKDFSSFWTNESDNWSKVCSGLPSYDVLNLDCLGATAETGGALLLTVGDWFKNLFNDYEQEYELNQTDYSGIFHYASDYVFVSDNTKEICFLINGNSQCGAFFIGSLGRDSDNYRYGINFGGTRTSYEDVWRNDKDFLEVNSVFYGFPKTLAGEMTRVSMTGFSWYLRDKTTKEPVEDLQLPNNDNFNRFKDYIVQNNVQVPVPQIKPQLVCPDGTKISMNISGSTFLAVDGTVMMVEKDGTAQVNGQLCNLNWQKPSVSYNPDGQPVITNPDGSTQNLDTGDATGKTPDSTDLEGCNGVVMCALGKLLDGLGAVVSAITGLVGKLLDGILALFVPENLDFISEEFTRITNKLTEKIAITETVKDAITGVFDGGGDNPLSNISIDLPITNEPLTFGNVAFIEEGVPILRRVISAIVVLYTLIYVYRKITGRGGVMER